jgi:hypothetical protein
MITGRLRKEIASLVVAAIWRMQAGTGNCLQGNATASAASKAAENGRKDKNVNKARRASILYKKNISHVHPKFHTLHLKRTTDRILQSDKNQYHSCGSTGIFGRTHWHRDRAWHRIPC